MGRLDLHASLVELTENTKNVFFQPPSNIVLPYPCIVYGRNRRSTYHADDNKYFGRQGYQVTVIETDPDSQLPEKVLALPYSRWENEFINDNLHHTVITVYN